jgi:hypothetical protein
MKGAAAGGGWQNYHIVVQHIHIQNLYLNNFIEMYSLKHLLVESEFWLLEHQIIRSLL